MQHVFWLREGQLAGRTGPNKDPWYPERLAAQGIAAVLSVNDGESVYAEDLQSCGIDYQQVSLSPNAPPRPGDHETCINALPHAYDFVMRTIRRKTDQKKCREAFKGLYVDKPSKLQQVSHDILEKMEENKDHMEKKISGMVSDLCQVSLSS